MVIGLTIIVCVILLIEAIAAKLVIVQFVFMVTALCATLLLAFDNKVTNIIGWILYIVGHILCTYIMHETDSPWIAVFQLLSIPVAIAGIQKELRKEKPNSRRNH